MPLFVKEDPTLNLPHSLFLAMEIACSRLMVSPDGAAQFWLVLLDPVVSTVLLAAVEFWVVGMHLIIVQPALSVDISYLDPGMH